MASETIQRFALSESTFLAVIMTILYSIFTFQAFVFDFMSEVYVWIGRQTTSLLRKKIMKLAREKFDQGYYKPPTSAMTPHHHGKARKISLTASELPMRKQSLNRKMSVHKFLLDKENLTPRPSYSIFLSMFEAAEWVIFKEKFCDWPDESRIIRMKGGPQAHGEIVKVFAQGFLLLY